MIAWAFLDVGNVLLDEDPLTYRVFLRHVAAIRRARPDRSFADLVAARAARAAAGSRWPLYEVAAAYLDEATLADVWAAADREVRARYAELSPPVAGAAGLLDRLAARYRLGLIANQPRECRARLAALGWLDRFAVVALSEEEGLFKPDPRLFRLALDRAGAEPSACLMIGDRIDNDLAPAAALGMATAWIRWPDRAAKGWSGDGPDGAAYLRALERTAPQGDLRPDLVVETVGALDAALRAWESSRGHDAPPWSGPADLQQ